MFWFLNVFFAILILDKHLFAKISSENFPLPRLLSFIDAGQVQKSFEELLANPIGIKHKNIIFSKNITFPLEYMKPALKIDKITNFI